MPAVYTPMEAIELEAGTRIEAISMHENSMDNPNNPNMVILDAPYGAGPKGEQLSLVLRYAEK